MESQTRRGRGAFLISTTCSRLEGKWWWSLRPIGTRLKPRDVQDRYPIRFPLGDGPKQGKRARLDTSMISCISRLQMDKLIFSSVEYSHMRHENRESRSERWRGGTKEDEVNGCMGKNVKVEGA